MRLICSLLLAGVVYAQPGFFPVRDLRAGMRGVGKTVFSGTNIEEFQVEILGVLENVGPKQSLILGRLSGGPLEKTGVMQGMSGSPVYIDGRLVGAVAMAFAFSKEPIAGIRPIQEMLAIDEPASMPPPRRAALWDGQISKNLPGPAEVLAGGGRMVEIATPVSFAGFTKNTIEHFGPQLRALGLEPMQGMSGAGKAQGSAAGAIRPGSMITAQLITGDLSIGADGTVTHIDGNRMWAFGHRFLSIGPTDMPFARSEVLTLLPNLSTSFKISAAREWAGAITQDRSVAVGGELGRHATMLPVSIAIARRGVKGAEPRATYSMNMVRDRILSPFLLQMAVFSAIDVTEQALGESTFAITGHVEFEGNVAPMKLDNTFAGDMNVPAQAAMAMAVPVSYVLQSGFEALRPKRVEISIEAFPSKRTLQIDQVWPSQREARPGDTIELTLVLTGENGQEITRKIPYRIPIGARPGPMQFTAADAMTINLTEFRQMLTQAPKSAAQLVAMMNAMRANTKAYVRVWRT
ncbi:MAG TPA: SpoIVB peptidase S55 domain-containing protein, partial [Bryobacteraceae bacterium]|nr:SpoIVB peptidase S55 domain-containing protein [Bryobacteraceae bacterium]